MGFRWQRPFCRFSLSLDFVLLCFLSLVILYSLGLFISVSFSGCFASTLDRTGSSGYICMSDVGINQWERTSSLDLNCSGLNAELDSWQCYPPCTLNQKFKSEFMFLQTNLFLHFSYFCFFFSPLQNISKMTRTKQVCVKLFWRPLWLREHKNQLFFDVSCISFKYLIFF